MRRERATDLLQDILDFIDRIQDWTPPHLDPAVGTDEKTLYAVLHALQHIGEAVSRLPGEVTDLAPEVPWASIRAMRNVIAHDYAGVDAGVVWETVQQRLPELRTATTAILRRLMPSQS